MGSIANFHRQVHSAVKVRLFDSSLDGKAEELRYKLCFCQYGLFCHPSYPSFADHLHGFDSLQRAPSTGKCTITFGRPHAFFPQNSDLVQSDHLRNGIAVAAFVLVARLPLSIL